MFGLENQKKDKKATFVFDLEKELMNREFSTTLKNKIELRAQSIKEALRSGDEKIEFEKLGILLLAYASLMKVFSRVGIEKKG